MSKRIKKVVPKYYPYVNAEAIDVKPICSEEKKKINNRLMRKTQKLTYPVYTIMNKQDMKIMIRNFLAPWKGLKSLEGTNVYHFDISIFELVRQSQLDILIRIYCPNIQL